MMLLPAKADEQSKFANVRMSLLRWPSCGNDVRLPILRTLRWSSAVTPKLRGRVSPALSQRSRLRQRGWTVRVHEASPELRAFGAGIFIWENGLRVLKAVGAYESVMANAHEAISYETRHGNRVIAEHRFTPDKGTRMLTMTRQHLYSLRDPGGRARRRRRLCLNLKLSPRVLTAC